MYMCVYIYAHTHTYIDTIDIFTHITKLERQFPICNQNIKKQIYVSPNWGNTYRFKLEFPIKRYISNTPRNQRCITKLEGQLHPGLRNAGRSLEQQHGVPNQKILDSASIPWVRPRVPSRGILLLLPSCKLKIISLHAKMQLWLLC